MKADSNLTAVARPGPVEPVRKPFWWLVVTTVTVVLVIGRARYRRNRAATGRRPV